MSLSTYYYDLFQDPFFTVSEFNRMFDAAFEARKPGTGRDRDESSASLSSSGILQPRMDVHESKENNEITASFELPGMKKDDVGIDVHNNRLVVSGQSTLSNTLENEGYAVRERRFGKFSRTLPIPSGTKPEDIKANMEHGVLTVRFPKSRPEQEPKKITIS